MLHGASTYVYVHTYSKYLQATPQCRANSLGCAARPNSKAARAGLAGMVLLDQATVSTAAAAAAGHGAGSGSGRRRLHVSGVGQQRDLLTDRSTTPRLVFSSQRPGTSHSVKAPLIASRHAPHSIDARLPQAGSTRKGKNTILIEECVMYR